MHTLHYPVSDHFQQYRETTDNYLTCFSFYVTIEVLCREPLCHTIGHLEQYFGNVQYMDAEQGREIRMRCALLGTEMQHIRNELNKIGVNVNQIAKWNNIEAEIVQLKQSMAGKTAKERYEIVERVQFLQKCQNEILLRVVQPSDMEEYVQRYERATEGVSKALWHIQG